MQNRFIDACLRVGVKEQAAGALWLAVEQKYTEAQRHYHNLTHIEKMLAALDESGQGTDTIELAIWFHDVVYEPMEACNEADSACFFEQHLGGLVSGAVAESVSRLILATDPRRQRSGRADEDLLIDIDLNILGSSRREYGQYSKAIREEYRQVAEDDFIAGRRAVLEGFLSQPIYATVFFSKLESSARNNLQQELNELEKRG
ncbi:MAG: hypothetical protein QM496_02115 [Verrucomicrobiota bacterium]